MCKFHFVLIFFQSVVSGTVDPDTFVVQRSYRTNNLNILERNLGGKDSCVFMTDNGIANIDSFQLKCEIIVLFRFVSFSWSSQFENG